MKKTLILLLLICSMATEAQTRRVKVVMRKGTVLIGELISFDPYKEVLIAIDGQNTLIPMNEVAYVDPVDQMPQTMPDTPVAKMEPQKVEEPVVAPKQEVKPVPVAKPKQEVKPVPAAKPKQEVKPVPAAKPKQEVKPVPTVEPKAKAKPDVAEVKNPEAETKDSKQEPAPVIGIVPVIKETPVAAVTEPVPASEAKSNKTDFRGFLLSKGNNVFLNCKTAQNATTDYCDAARVVFEKLFHKDGFWTVVSDIKDAHFVINYIVETNEDGRNKTTLSLSSPLTGETEELGTAKVSTIAEDNRETTRRLYKKHIAPLEAKIEKGNASKKLKTKFSVN